MEIFFAGDTIQMIRVYPNVGSFDNGQYKRTGGLCGNWRKTSSVPACNLYYKEGEVDKCLNSQTEVQNSAAFTKYWK